MAHRPTHPYSVWDWIMNRPPGGISLFRSYQIAQSPPIDPSSPVQRTALTTTVLDSLRDADLLERIRNVIPLVHDYPPQWVGDEIVPVMDLASLFPGSRIGIDSGSTEDLSNLVQNTRAFQRWFATPDPVTDVEVTSLRNPINSGRGIILRTIRGWSATAFGMIGRRGVVPSGVQSNFFPLHGSSFRRGTSVETAKCEVLEDNMTVAEINANAMGWGPVIRYTSSFQSGSDLLINGQVYLEPGQALSMYPTANFAAGGNADPLPSTPIPYRATFHIIEFPL